MERNIVERPARGFIDQLGREYSDVVGFTKAVNVPLGSQVTLLPAQFSRDCYDCYNGLHGVVVKRYVETQRTYLPTPRVVVRKLEGLSDWEPHCNVVRWDAQFVRIDKLGDDSHPVAGEDYPLCKRERFDLLWLSRDHRSNGWSNPATYTAHLYLRQTRKHLDAVKGMVRSDGTINPERLKNYWFKQPDLTIDEWARYGEGFPQNARYAYRIDWPEIAGEFERLVKEEQRFASLVH